MSGDSERPRPPDVAVDPCERNILTHRTRGTVRADGGGTAVLLIHEHESRLTPTAVVELVFPVRGKEIPVDHGYPLASAAARALPWTHSEASLGIHLIWGRLVAGRKL